MPEFKGEIYVTLRDVVNDPEGITIKGALRSLGFDSVSDVRSGKYLEVTLQASGEDAAGERVEKMCRELLANPVIEQFRFDLSPRDTGAETSQ